MHIGLAGPFQFASFREDLPTGLPLPKGLGGLPVVQLAREYLQRGHHVTVFTLDLEATESRWIEGHRLRVFVGPYRPEGRARDLFAVERKSVEEAIRASDVPFVHAHWTYEFALGALASGRPTLVTAHDAPLRILSLNPSPYRALRTVMAAQTLTKTKHMTAVSPYVIKHLRLMGYFKHIDLVPNGMTIENSIPVRMPAPVGRLAFASILNGGWRGLKNGERLLRAFAVVRRALPQATLTLYGAGLGDGEDAQAWAHAQGLAAGVSWRGYSPHAQIMEDLQHRTDVLVHPSLQESFGLTILEGMALGLPVLAGRRSGAVPWVTDFGRGALLVDVTSVDALALGMLRLGTEPDLSGPLAQHAHAYAREYFSMTRVANQYESLYQRLT